MNDTQSARSDLVQQLQDLAVDLSEAQRLVAQREERLKQELAERDAQNRVVEDAEVRLATAQRAATQLTEKRDAICREISDRLSRSVDALRSEAA